MNKTLEKCLIAILLTLLFALLLSGCATESGKKQQQWVDAMKGMHYEAAQ